MLDRFKQTSREKSESMMNRGHSRQRSTMFVQPSNSGVQRVSMQRKARGSHFGASQVSPASPLAPTLTIYNPFNFDKSMIQTPRNK